MTAHNLFPFLVISIPLLGIVAGVAKRWLRLKERQLELISSETAQKAAEYAARTDRLEQRVAVLERILTDRSTALADEIDRLRAAPVN